MVKLGGTVYRKTKKPHFVLMDNTAEPSKKGDKVCLEGLIEAYEFLPAGLDGT